LFVWLRYFRGPEDHPSVTREELQYIRDGRAPDAAIPATPRWRDLIRYRQTWGIVLGRFLLDPMVLCCRMVRSLSFEQRFSPGTEHSRFWMPFLGADLGNFAGGGLSSYWISRGWPVGKARRTVLLIFGPSMVSLLFVLHTSSYVAALFLFAYASFAYAACSTMFLSLPADAFHSRAVGTVAGMGGTGAGIGTMISTYLIGRVTDVTSFAPVITAAAIVPCIATTVSSRWCVLRSGRTNVGYFASFRRLKLHL